MTTPQGIRTLVDALDVQLSSQHANIVSKLDAILVALGSTPTTPGITLENIDTRLLTITTLLNSDLATMSQQLQQIYDLLANSIAPNLENVFFAINDLYALQASAGNPKLPLPISTINLPTGAELLHCQRVQWMIDYFFNEWMADVAQTASGVQGASVGIGLGVLVAGTGTAAAIPIAIFSAGIAGLLAAESQGLAGLKTQATTAKRAALRQALYAAQNASAAQAAWNATIDGFSDVHIAYRTAWKLLIWANWFNDLYDAANQNSTTVSGKWDLDGYDGSVCVVAPTPTGTWYTFSSSFGNGANRAVLTSPPLPTVSDTPIAPFSVVTYEGVFFAINPPTGLWMRCSSGEGATYQYADGAGGIGRLDTNGSVPIQMPNTTVLTFQGLGGAFTIDINIP
jgi:hypothetical protein